MAFYRIDRIRGSAAFILADDGREFEVPCRALPDDAATGAVLRLNLDHPVTGDWSAAAVDEDERTRRNKS